ncbi:conserved Plasmodium protein, unknown function [Plasmodium malariae]|uniref:Uncharacterized protein n=1 Tax=Plasmodium malariae TaxID=5858 RepID=A0A1A8W7Z7_PLAMA|nr:conserved Plasmodium protein, unknown function [Plasmodium malariae]
MMKNKVYMLNFNPNTLDKRKCSYELTKLLLIFYELQKYEPFINEKTFIKQNIGNNDFVNRIMGFIKDAENFSKRKKAEYENQLGIEEPNNF